MFETVKSPEKSTQFEGKSSLFYLNTNSENERVVCVPKA